MTDAPQKKYLKNRAYDVMKFIALIALPALGTLYFAIAGIWGLPNAEQIVGTITAVDTFLGLLLGISASNYHSSDEKYDGTINVKESSDKKLFDMVLKVDPDDLDAMKQVVFKVNKQT